MCHKVESFQKSQVIFDDFRWDWVCGNCFEFLFHDNSEEMVFIGQKDHLDNPMENEETVLVSKTEQFRHSMIVKCLHYHCPDCGIQLSNHFTIAMPYIDRPISTQEEFDADLELSMYYFQNFIFLDLNKIILMLDT